VFLFVWRLTLNKMSKTHGMNKTDRISRAYGMDKIDGDMEDYSIDLSIVLGYIEVI